MKEERKQELLRLIEGKPNNAILEQLVDEVIFLEDQLIALKKLPFIKVHPKNPELQKATPAARLYTQLSAQYNSALRTLVSLTGGDNVGGDSPLRKWVKEYADSEQKNMDA